MSFLDFQILLDFLPRIWRILGRSLAVFSNREGVFNTGLAKIKISIPSSQNQSDVVSYVAEVLHANGIELVNAFFSQDNIIVILNEKDSSRAYDILHSDIMRTL